MIIPWGTDAPVYHWPFATVGLIVVTTLAFLVTAAKIGSGVDEDAARVEVVEAEPDGEGAGPAKDSDNVRAEPKVDAEPEGHSDVERLMLLHGEGLHPHQWITSNFIHGDIFHLIGNMIFLWTFGIIVEGKIGWFRFLMLYLGLGIAQCASEQVAMLGASGGVSFGASAIIYGLLAICLIWAPRNELYCGVAYGVRAGEVEIPILWFGVFYIAYEAVTATFLGFQLSTPLLHAFGAIWGLAVGLVMLKAGWVDCENWDLLAVMKGRHGRPPEKTKKAVREEAEREDRKAETTEAKSLANLERLRTAIAEGHLAAALTLYRKVDQDRGSWPPQEADLLGLIKLLHAEKRWAESVPIMEQYVGRFPQKAARMRLSLAQLLIREQQRPAQALRVLAEIPAGALPESLEQARRQLERKANKMREDGVLELEGESW
jgi:membrane associated rhomboid family serine protease